MTDPGSRLTTHLSDRYALERELGAGGMATVYLAEDVRHHRKVAIKVLHPELSAVLGPERFLKEIELTASLQHPHILPLFDSGSADGLLYYVMPYVEGETLRRRLEREQQLPIADALRITSDVAEALEYAHRRGIVHRDVKPENILLHEGRPLVADFGIALAVQQAGGARMTQTGMSLGTPQYMAPEQAMGDKQVDHRADIYALGAITYEMLAGEPPFTGPNSQAIVAKVLTTDVTSLRLKRRSIPPHVENAVLTALEKMPADRFGSAAEFRAALAAEGAESGGGAGSRRFPTPGGRGRRLDSILAQPVALVAAAALLLITGVATGWSLRPRGPASGAAYPMQFAFDFADAAVDRPWIQISHDGRRIIGTTTDSAGVLHVILRDLGSTTVARVPGTEDAFDPVFSPDGRWISFTARGKLRKVPVTGGPPTDVVDEANNGGGAWMSDGSIIYTRDDDGLWLAPSGGGEPVQLTQLDTLRREFAHFSPQVLPGDRGVIYTSHATPHSRIRIEAFDFRSRQKTVLVEGAVFGRYSESGHLLFVRDKALFAVPFDPRSLQVRGSPVPVVEDVAWNASDAQAGYAVSANGTLVFLAASAWQVPTRIVWVDRSGREEPALPTAGHFAEPRLSPDGRWIAVTVTDPKRDVWLYDRSRAVLTQLTRAGAAAFNSQWMPDSRSLIYTHEDPVYDLFRIATDGSAASEPVVVSRHDKYATSISPDGRLLAYSEFAGRDRIMIVPLTGGEPRTFGSAGSPQRQAVFSPDGRSVAYVEASVERNQVYIAAVDGLGGRRQVSVDGGDTPRWTRGGRELIYRRGDAFIAVAVDPVTREVGRPVELFRRPAVRSLGFGRTVGYDVTPDGSRFLVPVPAPRSDARSTIIVLNWAAELKQRLPR